MNLYTIVRDFFDRPFMQTMMSLIAVDMNVITKRNTGYKRFEIERAPFVSWHKIYVVVLPFKLSSGKYVWFDKVWVKIVSKNDRYAFTVFSRSEYMAMKLCREVVDGDWCDEKSLT